MRDVKTIDKYKIITYIKRNTLCAAYKSTVQTEQAVNRMIYGAGP